MSDTRPFSSVWSKPDLLAPLTSLVKKLLATPGSCVNIERTGKRRRLRYRVTVPGGGKVMRKAIELPMDEDLLAAVETIIRDHRDARKTVKAVKEAPASNGPEWRLALRRRLLAICPRGRIIRRRVALVLDIAISLGPDTLVDYLGHEPWSAKSRRMGRPRKGA